MKTPDLCVVEEQQRRRCALRPAAGEIGAEHDELPGQPVGPDPGERNEQQHRHRLRREDKTEIRCRSGEIEDRERKCDRDEPVAERRRRLTDEEEAEVAVSERPHSCFRGSGESGSAPRGL